MYNEISYPNFNSYLPFNADSRIEKSSSSVQLVLDTKRQGLSLVLKGANSVYLATRVCLCSGLIAPKCSGGRSYRVTALESQIGLHQKMQGVCKKNEETNKIIKQHT